MKNTISLVKCINARGRRCMRLLRALLVLTCVARAGAQCAVGTYSDVTGACVSCPAGTTSAAGATSAAACNISTLCANLVAWYKLNGDLTDSSGVTGSATNQGGTLAFAKDTNLDSNLPYACYAVANPVSSTNIAVTPAINRNVPLSFAFWFKTTAS